ncbi:hypothetical protein Sjap_002934 [Stephania japonica]|uniref:Uncharacterized protein n=1 Tax=Stephania japonica TaxID=461633 RepID=A0AAP0PUZ7_9MAGN
MGLGAIGTIEIQLGIEFAPKATPKVAHKFDITIRSNGLRDVVETNHFLEEKVGDVGCIQSSYKG